MRGEGSEARPEELKFAAHIAEEVGGVSSIRHCHPQCRLS
jgi:hypothetical protein